MASNWAKINQGSDRRRSLDWTGACSAQALEKRSRSSPPAGSKQCLVTGCRLPWSLTHPLTEG